MKTDGSFPAYNAEVRTHDRDRIAQLMENLTVSAVKYVAEGRPVTFSVLDEDHAIEICVHNEGEPIPPQAQKLLFQLFHREHELGEGWGIGLTVCRALAEELGGSIHLDSSHELGSNFRLRLPRV